MSFVAVIAGMGMIYLIGVDAAIRAVERAVHNKPAYYELEAQYDACVATQRQIFELLNTTLVVK